MDEWFTAAYLNVGVHFNKVTGFITLSFINPFNHKSMIVLTDMKPEHLFGEDEEVLYLNICQEIAQDRKMKDIGKDLVFITYDDTFGWTDAFLLGDQQTIERCYRNELQDLANKRVRLGMFAWQLQTFNHISNGVLRNV